MEAAIDGNWHIFNDHAGRAHSTRFTVLGRTFSISDCRHSAENGV
jgi:hypothetical protein